MVKKLEDKSNNELLLEMKQMEFDHEAIKNKMLTDYDNLIDIERKHALANKIVNGRLNNA